MTPLGWPQMYKLEFSPSEEIREREQAEEVLFPQPAKPNRYSERRTLGGINQMRT